MSTELDRDLRRMVVLNARASSVRRRRAVRARQAVVLRGGRSRASR
ncbi:MAG: hypothetical protein AAGC49_07435 [Brevundimonas sp.]